MSSQAAPAKLDLSKGGRFLFRNLKYARLVELLIILVGVILFSRGFLDFQADGRLPGVEGDVFQVLDWVLFHAVRGNGEFPLWNHAIDTGMPYIADPMLHAYNPIVSIPVLLFGVWDGFKLGLLLSILLAALGMYWLMQTLGVKGPARTWAALMYAFAGQPNARFLQGQYLFILGFAWIPWCIAGLIRSIRSGNPKDYAATVLSMALLFFSGNAYYSFFMLIISLLLSLSMIIELRRRRPFLQLRRERLKRVLIVGSVSLLIIAVQLLPSIEFLPYLNKAKEVVGSHTLRQIFLDFTSKEWFRIDAYTDLPAKEEFYAYLGYTPFIALAGLYVKPRQFSRWTIRFLIILGFSILWIGLDYMPWRHVFLRLEWLSQFRHLLRILVYSSLALIVIAALGLENIWLKLTAPSAGDVLATHPSIRRLGIGMCLYFIFIGPLDLFLTHSPFDHTQQRVVASYDAAAWLKETDQGNYLVRFEPATDGHDALTALGLRFIEGWYHFTEIRSLNIGQYWNRRPVKPAPHYFIQFSGDEPPQVPGIKRIAKVGNRDIYSNPGRLPYSFTVLDTILRNPTASGSIGVYEVDPVPVTWINVRTVEGSVSADRPSTLVLMLSYYPSWQLTMDGNPARIRSVSGLVGIPLPPGTHHFSLRFQPASFYLGLALSILGAVIVSAWLLLPKGVNPVEVFQTPSMLVVSSGMIKVIESSLKGFLIGTIKLLKWVSRKLNPLIKSLASDAQQIIQSISDAFNGSSGARIVWNWLFGLALLVYALSRFIGIDKFPIYFFTDEAIQTNLAADLIRDHLHSSDGILLPTYFKNVYEYNLSLSVYLQLIPTYLFGKSVLITRATSTLVTVLGAAAVGKSFSLLAGKRWAWLGVLLFGLTPAWFLHSRTAFETSLMVTVFAIFLYTYMLYCVRSPRYIYLAAVFAALTFYSYAPGQIIILSTSLLLLVVDWRRHWLNRQVLMRSLPLLLLLALPYFRFQVLFPGEHASALRLLESHWVQDRSLLSKLSVSLGYYLQGLNPAYWFTPNVMDLARHQLDSFGHLLLPTAPLMVVGLWLAVQRRNDPPVRTVLVALLAIPMAGVLVGVGITRLLSLVIPFVLLAGLGLVWLCEQVRLRAYLHLLGAAIFILLVGMQGAMLSDALVRGAMYSSEYGMIGLQWGASQVFEEIKSLQEQHPDLRLFLTPTWANGTDVLRRFFLPDTNPLTISNAAGYLENIRELNDQMVFVLTQPEVDELRSSPKIGSVDILHELPYPDGSPGFTFLTFSYSSEAARIFADEETERQRPRVETVDLNGQRVMIEFPYLDMGELANLFDGDPYTLSRVYDANPAILQLSFPDPQPVLGITLTTGSMDFEVQLRAINGAGHELNAASGSFFDLPDDPTIELDFSSSVPDVSTLIIEITSLTPGDPFKIHLRELGIH